MLLHTVHVLAINEFDTLSEKYATFVKKNRSVDNITDWFAQVWQLSSVQHYLLKAYLLTV